MALLARADPRTDAPGLPAAPPRPTALARLRDVAIGAVITASGVLYATVPPSPDQWFLGYTGWRLSQGAVPYVDFADGNWPGCHWLHALSVLLLGNTPYTWRVFDFGLMLVCTTFAARTARALWGRAAAAWLLGLYPALYVALGYWFSGERDFVGAHLLFVALWCYWTGLTRRRAAWQLGTGAFIAASALVKPTFAVFGLFLALHCLLTVRSSVCGLRDRVGHVAIAGLASAIGVLAGFAALLLEGSSLSMFWDLAVRSVVVRFGHDERTLGGLLTIALRTVATLWHWIFLGAAAGLVANLLRPDPERWARNLLFPILWMTGLFSFVVQAQGLGYTLTVMYAATVPILCSGLGLVSLRTRTGGWRALTAAGLLLVPVVGTAKKWSGELGSSIAWVTGRSTREAHYARYDAGDGISAADAIALAAELRRVVPADGTILVWGRANAINFLAERPQPTRFHHSVTIARAYLPEPFAGRWNQWFVDEVSARAPAACVVNERELDVPPPPPRAVTFLRDELQAHYRLVRRVGDAGVYLRLPAR